MTITGFAISCSSIEPEDKITDEERTQFTAVLQSAYSQLPENSVIDTLPSRMASKIREIKSICETWLNKLKSSQAISRKEIEESSKKIYQISLPTASALIAS
ncbi:MULTISPECIES: hypothetical protein [unclassified Mycoplasma]|uniref:hypothetical protein n=1 Tax=unclassified Mycoplasma TaxID=2683645 RepID=UPI002B1E5D57|nr:MULTISPECIES: hypothetical protein [unclassified Mycoplasma]MEA4134325.1 hypothetical protein [Mycoplasma sp. 2704]MEA4276283.1 hypothetical protein [Mycoplasma sp. 21DD0573]